MSGDYLLCCNSELGIKVRYNTALDFSILLSELGSHDLGTAGFTHPESLWHHILDIFHTSGSSLPSHLR